jgi:mRNA interferase RelE/StbE
MAWKIEFERAARKELEKLDKTVARRILKFLYQRVGKLDDPRNLGETFQGTLSEFWRYRVGDHSILCSLEHERLVVLVLRIGHRREVYRQQRGTRRP